MIVDVPRFPFSLLHHGAHAHTAVTTDGVFTRRRIYQRWCRSRYHPVMTFHCYLSSIEWFEFFKCFMRVVRFGIWPNLEFSIRRRWLVDDYLNSRRGWNLPSLPCLVSRWMLKKMRIFAFWCRSTMRIISLFLWIRNQWF